MHLFGEQNLAFDAGIGAKRLSAMALLQRSSVSGCTSPAPVSVFTAPLPERVAVQTQRPQSLRLSICRAASEVRSVSREAAVITAILLQSNVDVSRGLV